MPDFDYLIVGGGMTADAVVRGIRAVDSSGSIGLLSAEPDPPYNRPPLSKGLWKGKDPDTIWRGTDKFNVELLLNHRVIKVDPAAKQVTDRDGETYGYRKLMLATGGKPRRLPVGGNSVIYFRSLRDYRRLRTLADEKEAFIVIGGSFIGSEIAAALCMQDRKVTMVFPGDGIGAATFPADLSSSVTAYYREKGVDVQCGANISEVVDDGERVVVKTDGGGEFTGDAVVAGIGIQPNTGLAESAGLAVDNGIVVDAGLRTSHPDVFAAGDVASFHNPQLDRRMRVEHEDNANTMGELAGRSMAGESVEYTHLPFFYSDLFELGYEAVGLVDSQLETVADWQEPFKRGVVYYLDQGRVRGVLLWDTWGKVDAARDLIAEPGPLRADDLKGRLGA